MEIKNEEVQTVCVKELDRGEIGEKGGKWGKTPGVINSGVAVWLSRGMAIKKIPADLRTQLANEWGGDS